MSALEGIQTCNMGGDARMDGGDIIRLGESLFRRALVKNQ